MAQVELTVEEGNFDHALVSKSLKMLDNFKVPVDTSESKTSSRFGLFLGKEAIMILEMQLDNDLPQDVVRVSKNNMDFLGLTLGDQVIVVSLPEKYHEDRCIGIIKLKCYNGQFQHNRYAENLDFEVDDMRALKQALLEKLNNKIVVKGQTISLYYQENTIMSLVQSLTSNDCEVEDGAINSKTTLVIVKYKMNEIFPPGVDPNNIGKELKKRGIGGMTNVFEDLLHDVVKCRCMPLDLQARLGITPIRGVLFHGPPGTGKTLIARNFCQIILCKTQQIVHGPALLEQWTGASEKNVRKLFEPAKQDSERYGHESPLHVLIFDELDSVARKRGLSPTNIGGDRVVNQLLTMIDGIEIVSNLLILATTNRIELIDEALLRPGRIEKHVLVSFPSFEERVDILKLKIEAYKDLQLVNEDIDLEEIARVTENFSGAKLASVVSSAFHGATRRLTFQNMRDLKRGCKLLSQEHLRRAVASFVARDEATQASGGNQPESSS